MYSGERETCWAFSLKASSLGNGSASALPVQQSPQHAAHVRASAGGALTGARRCRLQTSHSIFFQTHQRAQDLLLVLVFRYLSPTDSMSTFP